MGSGSHFPFACSPTNVAFDVKLTLLNTSIELSLLLRPAVDHIAISALVLRTGFPSLLFPGVTPSLAARFNPQHSTHSHKDPSEFLANLCR